MLDAFYARGGQTMNWVGVVLVLVAVVFFAVDLVVTTHGLPTFMGIVSLVVGILTLLDPASAYAQASLVILLASGILVTMLFVMGSSEALAARGRPVKTGTEGMVGEVGTVREPIRGGSPGWVFVHGELWRAVPAVAPEDAYSQDHEQTIEIGRRVQVVGLRDGEVLVVPFELAASEHPSGR